jgi:DNA-binding transcriptional MerR regulator
VTDGIKIGEILKETGVSRATIHHYVREGLLPAPVKVARNQARYHPDCVDRVRIIKGLQQSQRLSLTEVKELLAGASGNEGLERLRRGLEQEEGKAKASLLNPDRARSPLTVEQLSERTGFPVAQLIEFEEWGLLAPGAGRPKLFDPVQVDVADALANLAEAGFDEEHGWKLQDVMLYSDTLKDLLSKEVALFLQRAAGEGRGPRDLIARAQVAVERVTPLILALRRKHIRDLLDAALPGGDTLA